MSEKPGGDNKSLSDLYHSHRKKYSPLPLPSYSLRQRLLARGQRGERFIYTKISKLLLQELKSERIKLDRGYDFSCYDEEIRKTISGEIDFVITIPEKKTILLIEVKTMKNEDSSKQYRKTVRRANTQIEKAKRYFSMEFGSSRKIFDKRIMLIENPSEKRANIVKLTSNLLLKNSNEKLRVKFPTQDEK